MKILLLNNGIHVKNLNALLKYKNIQYYIISGNNIDNINTSIFDVVYSPCLPIDVSKYPDTKFLFGPHFSVFPERQQIDIIRQSKNVIYIQPSNWARDVWRNNIYCKDVRIESLPFGVDTEKFNEIKPINQRNNVFVYFKRRNPNELNIIKKFLESLNISFKIFDYVRKYDETEYINYLHESKFGIWLDAHESQGFALEEALSCNVPLLVWNVFSMNQENGSTYENIPATTIPYWDSTCGENFIHPNELLHTFNKFTNNINNYKPRDYILNNLSIKKCEEKFIELVNNI